MSNRIELNKNIVQTFIWLVENNDFGAEFDSIVAEDYNDHLEGQHRGRENLKQYLRSIKAAFPDLNWPIKTMIAEGDYVMVYNSIEATHQGNFGRFTASGNKVSVMAFQLYRIENEKLVEHWELADFVKMQQQLTS